jgi:hypothetical protein
MEIQGIVQNGVIVPSDSAALRDGTRVRILLTPTQAEPTSKKGRSVLDIQPVSVGTILALPTSEDDILGEMLEGRPRC